MKSVLATLLLAAQEVEEEHHEDPSQSHHWLWPERAEIIYGGIAFAVVAFLLWKFGLPQAKKMAAERTARIQREMDEAASAKAAADEAAVRIRQQLGDVESERQQMLADAEAQAAQLVEDGRRRLVEELAEIEAKADADIAAAGTRVVSEVQAEVARIAAAATEQLVVQNLDDATQAELIDEFVARVGAGATNGARS
jgi:F-type H+-transporting ATPase subunit b